MVDFVGQKRVFWFSLITFIVFIPISLIVAFILHNFIYSLYVMIGVGCVLMIVFVPSWPWLSLNPESWADDKEYFKNEWNVDVVERKMVNPSSQSQTTSTTHRSIPRNRIRK